MEEDDVAGEVGGDVTGVVGGDVTGVVGGDVTGEVGGDVTGEVGGDVTGEVGGDECVRVGGDEYGAKLDDGGVLCEAVGTVVDDETSGPTDAGVVVEDVCAAGCSS
jgi:hypothetical protein